MSDDIRRGKHLDHSNQLLICELVVTAQNQDAEVTATRSLKLLVDYALAIKNVLGITKKATSKKLKQNEKKHISHDTENS